MASKARIMILGTAGVALGIGYVMQYGLGFPTSEPALQQSSVVEITQVTDTTSAATVLPRAPEGPNLKVTEVKIAATEDASVELQEILPSDVVAPTFACDVSMTATEMPGALVALDLFAPCLKNERVTLHHNGMMISDTTDADGRLNLSIPALTERAVFIASFGNGEGAVSQIDVPSLAGFRRVVLQWQGEVGLDLHAREFNADYYADGHVWSDAMGTVEASLQGGAGFLNLLGNPEMAEPRLAQVYSFPTALTVQAGVIDLSVETEITEANCGKSVTAQTLEVKPAGSLKVQDLELTLPGCDAAGEFLLMDTLLDDLRIARG